MLLKCKKWQSIIYCGETESVIFSNYSVIFILLSYVSALVLDNFGTWAKKEYVSFLEGSIRHILQTGHFQATDEPLWLLLQSLDLILSIQPHLHSLQITRVLLFFLLLIVKPPINSLYYKKSLPPKEKQTSFSNTRIIFFNIPRFT